MPTIEEVQRYEENLNRAMADLPDPALLDKANECAKTMDSDQKHALRYVAGKVTKPKPDQSALADIYAAGLICKVKRPFSGEDYWLEVEPLGKAVLYLLENRP